MKVDQLYESPLKILLEDECSLVSQKVHSDDSGNIQKIELSYVPNDVLPKEKSNTGSVTSGLF